MSQRHCYPYGLIGNCSYIAYVGLDSNIDWLCWPYFDSSFVFGKMMDKKGGSFSITPATENYSSRQYYLTNTNVLCTEFECKDGSYRVIDYAPRFLLFDRWHKPLQLFRKVEILKGSPRIKVTCEPCYDYGREMGVPNLGSNHISFDGLSANIRLTSNVSKHYIVEHKDFTLTENKYFVLSFNKHLEAPLEETAEEFLRKTKHHWRQWVERSSLPKYYAKEVLRSALVLKLHQYEDTGAFIASGATSLPEHPGQERNWDYRYCWIRDAYFTLSALDSLSHFEETELFSQYLQNIARRKDERIQPVFKIDTSSNIDESILTHLSGYQNNSPVRIGNDAYNQIQNDVYGQIVLSLLPVLIDERFHDTNKEGTLDLIEKVLEKVEKYIDEKDAGIWEFRGLSYKHCESNLFHWAACKASVKVAELFKREKLLKKAQKLLKHSKKNIEECFDPQKKVYMSGAGAPFLNASELLLINMNYLKEDPEKAKNHLKALEEGLVFDDHLVYRYKKEDDFGETKSTFLICSFWYAEALACVGRVEEACKVMDKLINYSNHVGLLSEDISPNDYSQWGNFPQTYSHVGLINAAFRISRKMDRLSFE